MREEADLDIRYDGAYPHVYGGPIPYACLAAPPALLTLGSNGRHIIPALGGPPSQVYTVAAQEALEEEPDYDTDNDGYIPLT